MVKLCFCHAGEEVNFLGMLKSFGQKDMEDLDSVEHTALKLH